MNRDTARFTLQCNSCTSIFVEWLAITFERRIHRRHLRYFAAKCLQGQLNLLHADINWLGGNHLTLSIAGIGGNSEMNQRLIGLVSFQQILRKLGSFPKAQWQQTSGKRIQRTGMPSLLRQQQALGLDQRVVAGPADWLI